MFYFKWIFFLTLFIRKDVVKQEYTCFEVDFRLTATILRQFTVIMSITIYIAKCAGIYSGTFINDFSLDWPFPFLTTFWVCSLFSGCVVAILLFYFVSGVVLKKWWLIKWVQWYTVTGVVTSTDVFSSYSSPTEWISYSLSLHLIWNFFCLFFRFVMILTTFANSTFVKISQKKLW